jgi:hypothetical protein
MQLDNYLPKYEFNEIHTVTVDAPPERVFIAIKELIPTELSPIVFWMMDIRSLPAKLMVILPMARQSKPFLDQMSRRIHSASRRNKQRIVFGLVGQFWKLTGGEEPDIPSPQTFLDFDDPAFAKVAANLAVTVDKNGQTHCSTETRIHAADPRTHRKFAFYWRIISMGSAFIRIHG